MFGFITDLRKLTKGLGQFSMEFAEYRPMAPNKAQEAVDARNEKINRPTFQVPS